MHMNNAIFIGRFQPFHNGHAEIIKRALEIYNEVIVVVGSRNVAKNVKNPFTAIERRNMIQRWAQNELGNDGEREGKFYIYDLDDRSDYMAADTLEELAARCSDELKLAGWY